MPRVSNCRIVIGLVAGAACSTRPPTARVAALHACLSSAGHPARCGTIALPERRGAPDGRRVTLNVVVLPAHGAATAEPILFIHGGPGLAATRADDYVASALESERRTHDLVMIDMRGTGDDPSLECDLDDGRLQSYVETMFPLDKIRECAVRLAPRVDLTQYTTEIAAEDLDDARAALGIDRWSVFGASYGTRLALEYMRRYPTHVVRAALLGVLPPEAPIAGAFAKGWEQVFDSALVDCRRSETCRRRSPDLRGDLAKVLATLRRAPARATLWHAKQLGPEEVSLTLDGLKEAVFLDSYQPESFSRMLQIIHGAATGDMKTLIEHVEALNERRRSGRRMGLVLSIYCTEDAPRLHAALAADSTMLLGTPTLRSAMAACSVWPHGTMSPRFGQRVVSSIPTLLISGGRDPATPVYLADSAALGLSRVERLIEPGAGHAVLDNVVRARMAMFFDSRP